MVPESSPCTIVVVTGVTVVVVTVKSEDETPVRPLVRTVIFPVVAPVGTVTVNDVAAAAEIVAWIPLKLTRLFAAAASKFEPEMTT